MFSRKTFPQIVRQTPVRHGDAVALTVSTVQIAPRYYDTVVFDDSADKRHDGWLIGDFVINKTNKRAESREEAMEQHREALYEARTASPRAPQAVTS
ncbi:hypothetical protein [Streptomyces sp. 900116325]